MADVPIFGFWSYVHADDEADGGRIRLLAEDLMAEFAAITGGQLELFFDRSSIQWGDEWRTTIDEAIAQARLLIPIVTPRYFKSQACRDEILTYSQAAREAGLLDLIMPLYWITENQLDTDPAADEVMALIAERQYEDVRDARLEDRGSAPYRKAINRLATAIAKRSALVTTQSAAAIPLIVAEESAAAESDEPPTIEELADGESALDALTPILNSLGEAIHAVNDVTVQRTAEINRADQQGKPAFATRLRAANQLATDLAEPAGRIAALGQQYGTELRRADPLIRTLISNAHAADSETRVDAESFLHVVRDLVDSSEEQLEGLSGLVQSTQEVARMSSTARPVLHEMNRGLQGVLDGRAIFSEWRRMLDPPPPEEAP
jgi:hypothetical protein